MDERARIALLARVFAASPPGVEVGIGDDAAVLDAAGRLVWTIDEQVEGTHFRRDLVSWYAIGWRSFMAAASDVAAMGAEPWCALSALVLPLDVDDAAFEAIAVGQRDAALAVGSPIVGGNLARGSQVSVATTLLGGCASPVTRAGARPGDTLYLSGRVGLAAAGLRALLEGRGQDPRFAKAVSAWKMPWALIASGKAMGPVASAAVDVSDGLARDAGHIAEASGVQLVIDESAILEDKLLVKTAAALGADPLDLALGGGEDYALVAASRDPMDTFRPIGEVRSGRGVFLRNGAGERPLPAQGFDHFAAR